MTPHPTPDELAAYQAGRLPPARSRDIDAHLDDCETCRAALPPRDLSPDDTPPPMPPGYEFIEKIGSGGMGVVYRARRLSDGLEFAIKTLLPQHRGNAVLAGYLEREAAMTARLRHLRVLNGAQLRRYSDTDPTPFIEFPWVPGTTLAKIIGTPLARENPLRLVQWVIQCCKAVEAAHRHDPPIIHFDLKPENLLVYDRDGEAVLIDFGLASEWPPPADSEPRGGSGTPAYMAPEVADDGRRSLIGPATDVFSVGGMLSAILTGHPPYSKADFPGPEAVKEAARRHDLTPALRRLDACREYPALVAFTKRCLSLEPADRPADAGEAWRELDALVSTATRQRHRRGGTRRRWLLATAGLVAVVVLLLLLWRDRPPTKDELLTTGPWARYITHRYWTDDELARIHARFPGRFVDGGGKPVPPLDALGNAINPVKVGCYPLVRFHRPEWVEAVRITHDRVLDRPQFHISDFTANLPPIPATTATVPVPTEPGWTTALNGDRLCKKPLTVAMAYSNGQYIEPMAAALGGLAVPTEPTRFGLGPDHFFTGLTVEARGGGSRSYVAVDYLRRQWDQAEQVKLQVKVRGVPEVYEYDLLPGKLGWEKGIRDSEAD